MGNLISIENLNDPHDQTILRGHDMEVSVVCCACAPSSSFSATVVMRIMVVSSDGTGGYETQFITAYHS